MRTWYIDKISIDSHEKMRGTNAYNYYSKKYNVEIQPLEYGDYLFSTNDGKQIVFEYKTCNDFINSMENQSLFHEVSNQSINYEHSYLVVCGDFEESMKNLYFTVPSFRYKYKTMRNMLSNVKKQIGGALDRIYSMYVPIIFVEDEKSAFEKMLNISSKIADTKKYGGIVRPTRKKILQEDTTAIFLTNIKGIGEKKAKNITDELGIKCLEDLCKLKPSDFQSVDKITDKNVYEIWKKIHDEDLKL